MKYPKNQAFRKRALGRFRALLEASATSPAMLIYLDNHRSRYQEPNENYARELMELHTLGVNGGYTAQDIVEVARVFTGWRVINGKFQFDTKVHDNGAKIVLGNSISPNSGIAGGQQVLDILAQHPSTAKFICTKLLNVFVSDTPTNFAINQCASQYSLHYNKPDQIAKVLSWIFKSNEFQATKHFHNKVKTPIEFVTGTIRGLDATVNLRDNVKAMHHMGMNLLLFPDPDGWPEIGNKWVNTNQLRQRLLFSTKVAFNPSRKNLSYLTDPTDFFIRNGYETAEGVIGYLFEILLANDYSTLEWDEAMDILTDNGRVPFDIHAAGTELRVRNLLGTTLAYPSHQLQ